MSSMFTVKKRQGSLKNIHPSFQYKTTYSPPKLLPTISENRELKRNNAKELTRIISKFQGLIDKESIKFSDQLLRNSLAVLKAFSLVENNFQSLFEQLTIVFRRFTFALDDLEIQAILEKYKVREGCSYRRTCLLMDQELENVLTGKKQIIHELERKLRLLNEEYRISQDKWASEKQFLQSQVERYKKIANVEYVKGLEEKIQKLKSTISDLQTENKYMTKQNENLIRELDTKDNLIHEQQYQIAKLKANIYDLDVKRKKVQGYFEKLRNRFDDLLGKMIGIKESIEKVQKQNDQLVSQRAKLVSRAAVTFEDLTPRPKYKEVFKIEMKNHLNSTNDIFQQLVEKSKMENSQIKNTILLKKKHRKLQEAEAIREKVVDDICEAKDQLKKLENLK